MLNTVQELLAAIETLPEPDRALAHGRVESAVDRPAPAARAALGLLALDVAGVLAGQTKLPASNGTARLIILPETDRAAVAATA